MLNRTLFTEIEYSTSCSTQTDNQLHSLIFLDPLNIEPRAELVLRAINGSKELEREALDICNHILETFPRQNFFNLARAMLGNEKEREQFFKIAIYSDDSSESNKTIQAQAAYQLARFLFDQRKYLESQAWLMQSVILGYEKAEIDLCSRGMARDCTSDTVENYFHQLADPSAKLEKKSWFDQLIHSSTAYRTATNFAIITAIILSNKKIHCLDKMIMRTDNHHSYLTVGDSWWNKGLHYSWITNSMLPIVQYANQTNSPTTALLNQDTMLYKMAYISLKQSPRLFFEFMSYCAKNNILTRDNYQTILTFIQIYSSSKEINLLLEEGKKVLSELSFSQPANVQPQPFLIRQLQSTANVMQVLQTTVAPIPYYLAVPSAPPQLPAMILDTAAFNRQFPPVPANIQFGLSARPSSFSEQITQEHTQPLYVYYG